MFSSPIRRKTGERSGMNRVSLLFVVLACLFAVQPSWARTSSFVFDIAVICSTDCALTPISASVELSNGRSTVERQEWTTEMLAKIKGVKYRIPQDTPVASPRRMFTLPEAFDLHFYFRGPKRWRLTPQLSG
jgi:hypothetical protein